LNVNKNSFLAFSLSLLFTLSAGAHDPIKFESVPDARHAEIECLNIKNLKEKQECLRQIINWWTLVGRDYVDYDTEFEHIRILDKKVSLYEKAGLRSAYNLRSAALRAVDILDAYRNLDVNVLSGIEDLRSYRYDYGRKNLEKGLISFQVQHAFRTYRPRFPLDRKESLEFYTGALDTMMVIVFSKEYIDSDVRAVYISEGKMILNRIQSMLKNLGDIGENDRRKVDISVKYAKAVLKQYQ